MTLPIGFAAMTSLQANEPAGTTLQTLCATTTTRPESNDLVAYRLREIDGELLCADFRGSSVDATIQLVIKKYRRFSAPFRESIEYVL